MAGWCTCTECGRVLYLEDGPTCPECLALLEELPFDLEPLPDEDEDEE